MAEVGLFSKHTYPRPRTLGPREGKLAFGGLRHVSLTDFFFLSRCLCAPRLGALSRRRPLQICVPHMESKVTLRVGREVERCVALALRCGEVCAEASLYRTTTTRTRVPKEETKREIKKPIVCQKKRKGHRARSRARARTRRGLYKELRWTFFFEKRCS